MMCFFQHFIWNIWILCHIMVFLLFVKFVMFGNYIKEKKKMGSGIYVYGGKKGGVKKKEKKIEREKTKLVLFVYSLYLVQSVKL